MKINRDFVVALKFDQRAQYKIAQLANVCPYWLSRAINGAVKVTRDDQRLCRIAKVLGFPKRQIFKEGSPW